MPACVLGCCIALALAGTPAKRSTTATEGPSLLEQGEEDLARGELRAAAEAFTAHYRGLPLNERASTAGEYVVMYAADVYDRAWAEHADVADLESSRDLLRTFLGDVEAVHGDAQPDLTRAARARLEKVENAIADATAAAPDEASPPPAPATVTPSEGPPADAGRDPVPGRDREGTDRVAVALFVSGGTIMAGGVGMLAAGLAQATTRRAHAKLDAQCEADGVSPALCDQAQEAEGVRDFIANAERSDRVIALASIAPLLVGAGLLVGGAVRVTAGRRSSANIRVQSWFRRGGAGVSVSARF